MGMALKRLPGLCRMAMALSAVLLAGGFSHVAEAREVKAGDSVSVHFTCRLKNGQLAASSRQDLPQPLLDTRSPLFVPRGKGEPVDFVAGEDILKSARGRGGSFETEIIARLADHVIGMRKGEQKTVEVAAQRRQSSNPGESILEVAKVRRRAKEVRMTVDEFKQRKGVDPVVGQDYTVEPSFPGKVTQVTETEVVVLNAPPPEMQVETPFGRGKVVDAGKQYLIEIDARVGALVRSGGMVGRIVDVGEGERGMITLDYSHPFGGEVLDCELTLVDFSPPKDPQ